MNEGLSGAEVATCLLLRKERCWVLLGGTTGSEVAEVITLELLFLVVFVEVTEFRVADLFVRFRMFMKVATVGLSPEGTGVGSMIGLAT